MEIDKEVFKRMFPNLAKEMETGVCKITISSVRLDPEEGEKVASKKFDGYNPDVIDFIRRCDTEEQAEEIIAYLEKRGEISQSYASSLRKQLKDKGVRSFGPKKEEAYYLRQAGYR
ncbi:MAG: DUF2095 family protein [Candidatus Bathyarchaeia archaeon]|nr:DUF2095 family protein [Candidatus Bathyarchaeota archaeon]